MTVELSKKLEELRDLLKANGELRLLEKEDGGVRITDIFLNDEDLVRIEQYSVITSEDLIENHKTSRLDTLEDLLCVVKLWMLFAEGEADNFEKVSDVLDDFETDTMEIPKMKWNETVLDFMDKDMQTLLFVGM